MKQNDKTWEQIEKQFSITHQIPLSKVKKIVKGFAKSEKKNNLLQSGGSQHKVIGEWTILVEDDRILLVKNDMFASKKQLYTIPMSNYKTLNIVSNVEDLAMEDINIKGSKKGLIFHMNYNGYASLILENDYTIFSFKANREVYMALGTFLIERKYSYKFTE